jgi:hypothetical protein
MLLGDEAWFDMSEKTPLVSLLEEERRIIETGLEVKREDFMNCYTSPSLVAHADQSIMCDIPPI